jgi:MFS transporter, MHS family, proline/betaine transporter
VVAQPEPERGRAGRHGPSEDPTRSVLGSGIFGNVIEWYDFALYGYLAPVTAPLFFPSSDPLSALTAAFAVFAVGALARPFGGVLYGHIGDRAGRRTALITSIALMGASTFAMGLLPTHATAGALAPVLLLLLRLAQGVSTGGEFSGSITFLVEHAPPGRQGLYGSLANVGAVIGGALGALVGWLATGVMTPEVLQVWGWRIPFLCVLPISLAGLWLRLRVPDTPAYLAMKKSATLDPAPLLTAWRAHKAAMATVFGLNWAVAAGYYIVFVWLITDMRMAGLSLHVAMGIGTVGLLVGAAATLAAGELSDRFGRRTLLWVIGLATAAGAVPLLRVAGSGGAGAALSGQLALAVLVGGYLGTMPAVFAAQIPARVRCCGLAIGYNVAMALFGGTAPLVATLLVKGTGWNAAPGVYLALTAVVGLALVQRVADRASDAGPA